MKVTYTGKEKDFTQEQKDKLEAKFARLGKLVEKKGEKKAHVVLKKSRHICEAEITMQLHDHPLVSISRNGDSFHALTEAADKLEKQIHKFLEKQREPRRDVAAKKVKEIGTLAAVAAAATEDEAQAVRVYRVKPARQKPMTIEEAIIAIGDKKDYIVFRDLDASECPTVLIRRKDGHFDLVQG
ncbi:ribosomal subunit interface protein [Bryobacterales bacterium F-183]|nr:ribosomal subunit interface protein [Bryobacterales bacterium F-183]